jgi:hypothetical protein
MEKLLKYVYSMFFLRFETYFEKAMEIIMMEFVAHFN